VFVARDAAAAQAQAAAKFGTDVQLTQDPDVLDTWFSSCLWPFSTLGWPEKTADLARYYPTDVLVTGFDIIFFWVARMMMMGLHFMAEVPFRTVYIHGLVRDERGQKMSKSKGNAIDPLAMIEEYGADAMRVAVCTLAGPGRDIKLGPAKIAEGRAFVTKLWNAARFCEMNQVAPAAGFRPEQAASPLCRWLLDASNQAIGAAEDALESFRFDEYAEACTRFTWNVFCDWFLELAKPVLLGEDAAAAAEVRATAAYVLGVILRLLHPAMPFATEAVWDGFGYGAARSLVRAEWPQPCTVQAPEEARAELNWVVRFFTAIRTVRSEMNVPPSVLGPVLLRDAAPETAARAQRWAEAARRLARVSDIGMAGEATPAETAVLVLDEATLLLPLAGLIDVAAERARLAKEAARAEEEAAKTARKLENADFVNRAPPEIVAENRARVAAALGEAGRLRAALARLAT
jgi:valyl-tRNA synthetase